MNTLTKGFAKRALSMLLVTIMVFSLGIVGLTSASAAEVETAETGATATVGQYIYLDATKLSYSDAIFKIWAWYSGQSGEWITMNNIGNGWYSAKITKAYTGGLQFCRINPNDTSQVWNRTSDLSFGNNLFTGSGFSDSTMTGSWSTHDTTIYLRGDGTEWDTTANTMMDAIGSDVFVKEVELAKGKYYFDVMVSGTQYRMGEDKRVYEQCSDWALYTDKDYSFAFYAEGGTYEFKYNTSSNKLTITPQSTTYSSSVYLNHNVTGEWKKESTAFTQSGSTYTYSLDVVGTGTFNCDFILNKGETTEVTLLTTGDAATANDATINIDAYGSNIELTYTQSGTYTFTLDLSTKKATIAFEAADVIVESLYTCNTTNIASGDTIIITPYALISPEEAVVTSTTYALYMCDSDMSNASLVTTTLINSRFEVSTSGFDPGKYYYYVEATVVANGTTIVDNSSVIGITVTEADTETLSISAADVNVYAGKSATIKATSNITDGRTVTYEFILNGESIATNTKGEYTVDTTDDDAGNTLVYTIKASVTALDGITTLHDEITVNVKVVATGGEGDNIVTIYFKSAESYGYVPSIKFGSDGTYTEMTKSGVVIGHNTTNTGHYWWYSATTTAVDGVVTFSLTSERFFKDCTYTLDITTETPEVAGVYEYYFAIDNLNLVSSEVVNLTGKEYKNYFNSIIDMITEVSAEELAETGASFLYVALGDANGDGKVNVRDATLIQKDLAKIAELSEVGTLVADVNNDGSVTIKDATAIQKQIAGL